MQALHYWRLRLHRLWSVLCKSTRSSIRYYTIWSSHQTAAYQFRQLARGFILWWARKIAQTQQSIHKWLEIEEIYPSQRFWRHCLVSHTHPPLISRSKWLKLTCFLQTSECFIRACSQTCDCICYCTMQFSLSVASKLYKRLLVMS